MGRLNKDVSLYRKKNDSSGSRTMFRVLMLLCVVGSMALVLQLNINNQHDLMLRKAPRIWTAQPASPTCRPWRHLVFLKTHKCASSTLQNMFLRFAAANNLSVALPVSGVYLDDVRSGHSIKYKELRKSPFAPPSLKYHFLVHHTRLNVRGIQQVTYNDSVWVTVLREPSAVFESMFHYYRLQKFFGATFDHLLWKLGANEGVKMSLKNINSRYQGRLGRNQMSFDLGLEDTHSHQLESFPDDALTLLDNTFHLVMIAERMDESLILLKHLLCWRDEDMVTMPLNVRRDSYRVNLGEQMVATLHRFNADDVKLYNYFKEKFDKQVESFGRARMDREVANLRAMRDKVRKQCGFKESTSASDHKYHQTTRKDHTIGYQIHINASSRLWKFCHDIVRPGAELTEELRRKQYFRYSQQRHHHRSNMSLNASHPQAPHRESNKRKYSAMGRHGNTMERRSFHHDNSHAH